VHAEDIINAEGQCSESVQSFLTRSFYGKLNYQNILHLTIDLLP